MLFLTFVFAFIYIWTVAIPAPDAGTCPAGGLHRILFNVHLGLHWITYLVDEEKVEPPAVPRNRNEPSCSSCASMAAAIGPLLGLYLALVGVSVGMLVIGPAGLRPA